MDSNKLNHNDDLDIVMIKLELTISEKQLVEDTLDDSDLSIDGKKDYLEVIIGEQKAEQIIEWLKK